jgi:HK97 family phage major capsid protein
VSTRYGTFARDGRLYSAPEGPDSQSLISCVRECARTELKERVNMALLTTTSGISLSVEEIAALVVRPLVAASTVLQTTTVLPTNNSKLRIPIVTGDPQAGFVPENNEIPLTDAALDEVVINFTKLAALSRISSEALDDSDPAIAALVGEGIARNMARVLDKAFFAASTSNGPAGIPSLVGLSGAAGCQVVNVTGTLSNLDPFAEAISRIEAVGGKATSFCADTATIFALSKVKEFTGSITSNQPLLAVDDDVSKPTTRTVLGVPLWPLSSGVVPVGQVWAWDSKRVMVGMRNDVSLMVSPYPFFTADAHAIRATQRFGFGFPHPQSVIQIVSGGS